MLVANPCQPSDDYVNDPAGAISIIDISGGVATVNPGNVMALGFDGFSEAAIETDGGRVFGNFDTASVNQDLEPEYMAVSPDGRFAFVTLQEINAVANATSGTTTLYSVSAVPVPGAVALLAIGLYRLRGRHTANPG